MRVSFVLLAIIWPALFSSLVSVSVIGEGRSEQNIAQQSNGATAFSTLLSEWESSAFEVLGDDVDDDISSFSLNNGLEEYLFSASETIDVETFTKLRANIIRGPPLSLNHLKN